jgi:CheY-like chemotaxis protein
VHSADQAALKHRPARRDRVWLLVVDQDELVRSVLARLLQRAGYAVQTAATAHEALEVGRQSDWDCLVTELDLPDASGLELYARLLFQGRERLPTVFLAIRPLATLEWSLKEAHWVRLLRKPCAFTDLLATLEQCLGAPRSL